MTGSGMPLTGSWIDALRISRHLSIGRALLLKKNPRQISENIFEIVYHLDKAIDRFIDQKERTDLAGYTLTAALKTKSAGAYQSARRYLNKAMVLLPESPWTENYDLTLSIYNESFEIAYLTGNLEDAETYFNAIMQHAGTPFDRVRAYEIKIISLTTANQPTAAIDLGIDALKDLGVRFPRKTPKFWIALGLIKTKWLLRNKTQADLLNLPEMTDYNKLALARILMRMTEPTYVESPDFLVIAILKLLVLTLRHGNSAYSAFAYATYGAILTAAFGNFEKGREYADLALKAIQKFKADQLKAKVNLLIGGGIHHWTRPLKEDLDLLMTSYNSGVETGDHSFASYALTCYMYTLFFLGKPLTDVSENFSKYYGPIKNLHHESSFQEFRLWYQLVENLMSGAENPLLIEGRLGSENEFIPQWQLVNDLNRLGIHNIGKMILCYLFDDVDACLEFGKKENSISMPLWDRFSFRNTIFTSLWH